MGLAQLGDFDAAREEGRGRDYQDRRIDQKGDIERQRGVEEVVAYGLTLRDHAALDATRLYQRRMQIKIVRHDGRAEDADGDIQTGAIQTWHQTACHRRPIGRSEDHVERHARTDQQHHAGNDRLELADPVVLQGDDQHHVEAGEHGAPRER